MFLCLSRLGQLGVVLRDFGCAFYLLHRQHALLIKLSRLSDLHYGMSGLVITVCVGTF